MYSFKSKYLNFEFRKAQSSLKEIVELKLLKDWNEIERKIFSTSYLRLAQMDEIYRDQWIGRFLDFNKKPFIDEDIFPPPFIEWVKDRYQKYQMRTDLWYGQNIPQDVKAIIINGEIFSRLGFSRRIDPDLKYRVTLVKYLYDKSKKGHSISDEGSGFVLILSGRNLMNYSFEVLYPQLKVKKTLFKHFSEDVKPEVISSSVIQKQVLSNKALGYESKDFFQSEDSFKRQFKFEDNEDNVFDNNNLQSLSSVQYATAVY